MNATALRRNVRWRDVTRVSAILVVSLAAIWTAPAMAQAPLTFSSWVPPTHHLTIWQKNWAAEVEKATAGRVKFQELPKHPAAAPGTFDAVRDGLMDLSFVTASYTPARHILPLMAELPGAGATIATMLSYSVEKRMSKTPEKFGTGIIQGVAGPESANNAAAQTSFIPMLTLGIPSNAVMAMMVGGMMIHGIIPGPQVMTDKPGLFWGMIASMWVGNLMLIVFNLPMVGVWVKMLTVPYRLLSVAILFFCCIGVYSVNNSAEEVLLITGFGLLGYFLIKMGCEPAPMLLGFILGPMMEEFLRRALLLSKGSPMVLVTRPISATMLIISLFLLVILALPFLRKKREETGIVISNKMQKPVPINK